MITGMMHWREGKVAQKQQQDQQPPQPQEEVAEWTKNLERASPEEMAEEMRGWQRHRHKQRGLRGSTRPSPGFPSRNSR
jgi:hypothetical protein